MNTARADKSVHAHGLSDDQLVDFALKGDGIAFRQIMQRHNRHLYRVARGILGEDAEAEDVVQEAYMRAFQHMASFRRESALGTWLTRIVINEAVGRKRKRRPTVDLSHVDMPDNQEEARVIMFPGASNPETETGRREMRRLLERAVDELPAIFRIVFVLRDVEQMSVEETAIQLQLKPETVKTRLHRARRLLRTALEEKLGSTLHEAYSFDGWRCERLTKSVLRRLQAVVSNGWPSH
jgi:RNA polymerase sigma-70 factor (ECF subfamily)